MICKQACGCVYLKHSKTLIYMVYPCDESDRSDAPGAGVSVHRMHDGPRDPKGRLIPLEDEEAALYLDKIGGLVGDGYLGRQMAEAMRLITKRHDDGKV